MTPAARMPHLGATARVPTRRAAELWLLLFAVVVVFAAEAIVESAQGGRLDWHLLAYGAGVPAVAGIVAHLVVRWVAPYADPLLLPCVVALNGLGLVMIHRGDLGVEQQYRDSGVPFPGAVAPTQVLWTACGLLLFLAVLVLVRDHRALAQYAYTLALVGLFLLVLPAVLPASLSEVNGARIWIKLPGFSIQPGEFAKILLTVFAAAYLVAKRDVLSLAGRRVLGLTLPRGRDFGPLLAAWAVCIGMLVRENDLGTSLLFFGLFLVLLYVATERISWVIVGLLLFTGGAYLAYGMFDTVRTRVTVWLHVFTADSGDQMRQSLFGLGTGGMFGTGLGSGHPELVPLPRSDFIISSFGEELGLFGLVALLLIYAVLIMRGFAAGLAVRDSFGTLLAAGLSFLIGLQLFIVVAGVTRLLPQTGLVTPWLSYGGSALLANYILLALLLRVSDSARRPADRRDPGPAPIPVPTRAPAQPAVGSMA